MSGSSSTASWLLIESQKEAFLLRHVEDMAYEDIATVTGVGLSALRMRVKRACDTLRARLTEMEQ
jgi:RNA polymerase sigma-70 factor (ECF subfamily)